MQYRILLLAFIFYVQPLCAQQPTLGTSVQSDSLELTTHENHSDFHFQGNVNVRSKELIASCNDLHVITQRKKGDDKKLADLGGIEEIVGTGHVRIQSGGRRAKAGKVRIDPNKGTVVLTQSPEITDEQGIVHGSKITLIRNEQRVLVEGGLAENGESRASVVLPMLEQSINTNLFQNSTESIHE